MDGAMMTLPDGTELHAFKAGTLHEKATALRWLSLILANGYVLTRIDYHDDIGAGVAFLKPAAQKGE